jgi:hypothetical protein
LFELRNIDLIVEEIKRRISILDVLRLCGLKMNNNGFIKSIYKDERIPSLKIYPEDNSFFCFATEKTGDQIQLYMDIRKIDFKTAKKELIEKAGICIKEFIGNSQSYTTIKKQPLNNRLQIKLTEEEQEIFEERSAIVEFDGNLKKEIGEGTALQCVLERRLNIQNLVYESLEKFCFGVNEIAFDYLVGSKRNLEPQTIKEFRLLI